MNRVKAISGATASEFRKLEDQAIKLGASSVFSATEVAQAQEMMASAGFKVVDILKAMRVLCL
ncbi:phage tail tape measure protein [Streptococcus equi subsp. equi]|uniref:phage tail tape measure protein n=1 Tax=Streptococcus equi TaxID=1336 RepID=UPI0022AB8C3A|nr:phage tail tape measure protein [Streptococcus equi]MCD3500778.1 phage tail tape measure protein [Streptococcus equi subsp. equi]